ncbi:MAG TPA: thioredoxin domain-containing protein [Acidobacteriaceae bacterium]|jgi:protein-disulfide isomerase|nr:thioredoxin domain-containing protein [Acidobacteriaceae bacterium]
MREIIGIVLNAVRTLRKLAWMGCLVAVACQAQTNVQTSVPMVTPAAGVPVVQPDVMLTPEMARRIEVMIRNKAQVSPDSLITIGVPSASDYPGYEAIMVTLTVNGVSSRPLPFLLSSDGKTLAQLNKFDLSQNPRDMVPAAGRPALGGPENAPVLIVMYDDLECPFCAQMNAEIFPALLDRYKDEVRVVYRDFPLSEIHPWAMHAAVDANCLGAASTTSYWNFVNYVHAHAGEIAGTEKTEAKADQTLDKLTLDEGARQKVDAAGLAACVQKQDDSKMKASVEQAEADPLRLNSAPVLFINGEKVDGVVPIETIYRIIDGALIAAGQTPPPPPPVTTQPAAPATQPAPLAAKPGS